MSGGDFLLSLATKTERTIEYSRDEMWLHNLNSLLQLFIQTSEDLNKNLGNEDSIELLELSPSILRFKIRQCSNTLDVFIKSTRETHTDLNLVISGDTEDSIYTFNPKDN